MKQSEKIGLFLAFATLVIGVLTWQYPRNNPDIQFISMPRDSDNTLNNAYPDTMNSDLNGNNKTTEPLISKQVEPSDTEPLIKELTYSLFILQLKQFSINSEKINYIITSKHLLIDKISFKELNSLLSTISTNSSKLKAMTLLNSQVQPPNEKDLDNYLTQFSTNSSKQKALALVY